MNLIRYYLLSEKKTKESNKYIDKRWKTMKKKKIVRMTKKKWKNPNKCYDALHKLLTSEKKNYFFLKTCTIFQSRRESKTSVYT